MMMMMMTIMEPQICAVFAVCCFIMMVQIKTVPLQFKTFSPNVDF
jgi:hypothetical protein